MLRTFTRVATSLEMPSKPHLDVVRRGGNVFISDRAADILASSAPQRIEQRIALQSLGLCRLPTLVLSPRELRSVDQAFVLQMFAGLNAAVRELGLPHHPDLIIRTACLGKAVDQASLLVHDVTGTPVCTYLGTREGSDKTTGNTIEGFIQEMHRRGDTWILMHPDHIDLQRAAIHGRAAFSNYSCSEELIIGTGVPHARKLEEGSEGVTRVRCVGLNSDSLFGTVSVWGQNEHMKRAASELFVNARAAGALRESLRWVRMVLDERLRPKRCISSVIEFRMYKIDDPSSVHVMDVNFT